MWKYPRCQRDCMTLRDFARLSTTLRLCTTFHNFPRAYLGAKKKTNKQKTHKHFSDNPCGTIVPGTNPHPSQGQTGENGDFTVEFNRKRPVCPRDGSQFVPGRGPVCPRDSPCLSWTPSRPQCLCLLVFSLPDYYTAFPIFTLFAGFARTNSVFWGEN